jgi:hypothetical protein
MGIPAPVRTSCNGYNNISVIVAHRRNSDTLPPRSAEIFLYYSYEFTKTRPISFKKSLEIH